MQQQQQTNNKQTTTTTTGVYLKCALSFCVCTCSMDPSAQPVTGAAQRRKPRRLRSWWRHEQQSIAAVLAAVTHHSHSKVGTVNAALRGQKKVTSTRGGTCRVLRTLLGRWQAHRGGSGQRHCLEPLAAGEAGAARQASRTSWSRLSMLLYCRRWNSCPNIVQFFAAQSTGGCRAGYRSAEDLTGQDSAALGGSSASAADGGTVGGCADCRVFFFAPAAYCRADRRLSSFGSCWRRGAWRFSRFSPKTGFSSVLRRANR